MFAWASVAHMVLPLGSTGISEIANNEPALLADMHGALGDKQGFYIFPAPGWKPGDSSERKAAAMRDYDRKLASNPAGILIYHPPGRQALTPRQLVTEFLAEVLEALLAVILLAQTRLASYAAKVGFVTLVGALAAMPTNLSYWNWYGFPGSYTGANMASQAIGFLAAGLAAAALLRQRAEGTAVTAVA
jgi:hypothetical protein